MTTTSIYDKMSHYTGPDGAEVYVYEGVGVKFYFRPVEGSDEAIMIATRKPQHVDDWRMVDIEEWEGEMGGEVPMDDLTVFVRRSR